MTEKDREKFFQTMAVFSETFNRPISDGTLETYFRMLSKWPLEQVQRAAADILAHVRFFPVPADFITRLETSKELTDDERALEAWVQVKELAESGDPYMSVTFEDSAIAWTIRQLYGGYTEMHNMSKREFDFSKKDFISLYKIHRSRNQPTFRLAGLFEKNNGFVRPNEHNQIASADTLRQLEGERNNVLKIGGQNG